MSEPDPTPVVLLVDDEPSILSSLRRLFRPLGYRVLTAGSGAEGLNIVESEPIDLVVSDMRMPEMDGARFLELVRERRPDAMRILLTGYADIASTIDAINRGEIYRYIAKPWDDNDLVLIVRKALEQARLERENRRLNELAQRQNAELLELNASLERKVAERTEELEQANGMLNLANDQLKRNFMVSIKMFSGLIELREGMVGGHTRRVADLARKLAVRMELDGKQQQDIFLAGLLHDIGKIGFSDALLAKPVSRMVAEDLVKYRKHSLVGEAALMPLAELHAVASIVRSHHERFDGRGFPDGLIGLGIPIGARILAVVNDYDALQAGMLGDKRSSPDEAKTALNAGRHRQYDAQVVDAFVDMLGGVRIDAQREIVVPVAELQPGMVLARDLISHEGTLMLAADYVLDATLVRNIQAFARREGGMLPLRIRADKRLGA